MAIVTMVLLATCGGSAPPALLSLDRFEAGPTINVQLSDLEVCGVEAAVPPRPR